MPKTTNVIDTLSVMTYNKIIKMGRNAPLFRSEYVS